MAPEKVTLMILDVDLKCPCCYKKVKKLLCKFPQIRDQVFDEAKNQVRITVVCCNPEKIRDKLCCKGGKAIQRIEIVEDKPKEPEKPKPKPVEKPKEPEKPKPVEKPKESVKPKPIEKPKEPEKPKQPEKKPNCKDDKPKPDPKPPPVVMPPVPMPAQKPKEYPPKPPAPAPKPRVEPQPEPVTMPEPMHGYPPPVCQPAFPVSTCCPDCYAGRSGGPCEYGYGRPVPPPPGPCYEEYGSQYGYGYDGNRACYVSRCDYFNEDNPQGCWIM